MSVSALTPAPFPPPETWTLEPERVLLCPFRLPRRPSALDGHTSCTLWTPFNKLHIPGQMFISSNYICFASKEEDRACYRRCGRWSLGDPRQLSHDLPGRPARSPAWEALRVWWHEQRGHTVWHLPQHMSSTRPHGV